MRPIAAECAAIRFRTRPGAGPTRGSRGPAGPPTENAKSARVPQKRPPVRPRLGAACLARSARLSGPCFQMQHRWQAEAKNGKCKAPFAALWITCGGADPTPDRGRPARQALTPSLEAIFADEQIWRAAGRARGLPRRPGGHWRPVGSRPPSPPARAVAAEGRAVGLRFVPQRPVENHLSVGSAKGRVASAAAPSKGRRSGPVRRS